LSHTTSLK